MFCQVFPKKLKLFFIQNQRCSGPEQRCEINPGRFIAGAYLMGVLSLEECRNTFYYFY